MSKPDNEEIRRKEGKVPEAPKKRKSLLMSLFQKKTENGAEDLEDSRDFPDLFPEEPEPEENPTVPEPLLALRREWCAQASRPEPSEEPETFLADRSEEVPALLPLLESLSREAEAMLHKSRDMDDAPVPCGGEVKILFSPDFLTAWCFLFPPLHGGEDVTLEQITNELAALHVEHGLLEGIPQRLAQRKPYFQLTVVAKGDPPIDGENGKVVEIIPSTAGTPHIESSEDTVDYKDLNWIIHVNEGDLICRITVPTNETPGVSVQGKPVHGKNGIKVIPPAGPNTVLSKDGLEITSKVDGQVFYERGKYKVIQMLTIEGDVDLNTGNINVLGNLLVRGNVCEGFVVKASGDITVKGAVEGATIIAGGNIFVSNGMNGNSHGTMDAGGDIRCRYLENAAIRATGSIYMESIIHSTVVSDEKVMVTSGRGVIIGGNISAMCRIDAKVVGNKLNHPTFLIVGRTSHFLQEKDSLTADHDQAVKDVEDIEAQMEQLGDGSDPAQARLLKSLQLKFSVSRMKESRLAQALKELEERESKLDACQINVGVLYPTAQVTINGATKIIFETQQRCKLYKKEGEVIVGTM